MPLKLFNTLGRSYQDFTPVRAGQVSFYTCGPTVYNLAHIGNMRAYIVADSLRRWLVFGEHLQVQWVLNITDIEDKVIRDAKIAYPDEEPMDAIKKLTEKYAAMFFDDLEKLNIPRSVFLANPRATEFIPQMQELICKIFRKGYAYVADGSIFFNVKKWAEEKKYGKLLALDLTTLMTGTRTLADEVDKNNVADFALWKAYKPGEPFWDFDFLGENLPGRPGWHLECSVMEQEFFALPFDIHSGGVDLIFPHHEDEIAQSCCGYGMEPTRFFVHNEHLMVEGKKMSKSLGNFYTLRDLQAAGHDPEVVRFFLVTNHYRSKVNLSDTSLTAAANGLEKLRNFLLLASAVDTGEARQSERVSTLIAAEKSRFVAAMENDLNTPVAVATLYALASAITPLLPLSKREFDFLQEYFIWLQNVFGVHFLPQNTSIPTAVKQLAEARQQARVTKNWAESDRLRDEIEKSGYVVRDSKDGYMLFPLS